jgi:membrane fusion protein, multidrug efflux system
MVLVWTVTVSFYGCSTKKVSSDETKAIPVTTMTVRQLETTVADNYVGVIEESSATSLSFATLGSVERIYVDNGMKVSKGQLLAELDKTSLQSSYDAAVSTLNQAKDAYARMKQLYDNGSLPQIKWIEVQSGLQKAQSMEQIAQKTLQNTQLIAPSTGIIASRTIEAGANVVPGITVMKLINIEHVKVKISVSEAEISKINKGDEVSVTIGALDNDIRKGKITEKGVIANPLSHTYDVKIDLDNPTKEVMPGMVCNVSLLSKNTSLQIILPGNAIQVAHNGECFVWVAENGLAQKRTIITNGLSKDGVIVSEGLSQGEQVIIEGRQKVSNGMKIAIQ